MGPTVLLRSLLGLEIPDPSTWSWWIWTLHGMATIYTLLFFVAWFRFRKLWKRVKAGAPGAKEAFNDAIRGFPWSFYAKMLGAHAQRVEEEDSS